MHIPTTRGIANKGFRGMRRFVACFNFSCNLIGNCPESLLAIPPPLGGILKDHEPSGLKRDIK